MKNKKILLTALAVSLAFSVSAQGGLVPELSADVSVSSGARNLDKNTEYGVAPGLSNDYAVDLNLMLKGDFKQEEKEDKLGYEAALTVDLEKLNENSITKNYSNDPDVNRYSLIQPMIDWYEANMAKYKLPKNPCGTPEPGRMWPGKVYGSSPNRYEFIKGSTVERYDDVVWTSTKWNDASQLYYEIQYWITYQINQLNSEELSTGNVTYSEYVSMDDATKRLAEIKMKALKEFKQVANGSSTTNPGDMIKGAYFKVTNIAGVADARFDFMGKRLTVGKNISSNLGGQTSKGSAINVALKKNLIKGLSADLAVGIAGGDKQVTKNYDKQYLDYYRGISGELAVKGDIGYEQKFDKVGTLSASVSGVLSDLLVANERFAADLAFGWDSDSDTKYGFALEGYVLNHGNRNLLASERTYTLAYSGFASGYFEIMGIKVDASAEYKSEKFSHAANAKQDKFFSYSLDNDYFTANLKQAMRAKLAFGFDAKELTKKDFLKANLGGTVFLYGDNLDFTGYGLFADAEVSFKELIKLPIRVFGNIDFFQNNAISVWDDMNNAPATTFIDYTKFSLGAAYAPVENFELSLIYSSVPSYSRTNPERLSSVLVGGTVKF